MNSKVQKNKIVFLFCLIIFFIVISLIITPIFELNDDREMRNIVCSKYGEKYSAYSVFIGYPLSLLLSKLYMLFPMVPWYGLLFSICIIISAYIVLEDILFYSMCRKNIVTVLIGFIIILSFYVETYIVQQFTIVAGVLAATAIYEVIRKKSIIISIILAFLSFEIRSDVFLASMPFLVIAILWTNINEKKWLQIIKKSILQITVIILIFICGTVANSIAYSSEEWRDYKEFNRSRAKLYDYTNFVESVEYKEQCDKIGISERDYYIANNNYLMLDNNINNETINMITEIVIKKNKDNYFVKIAKVIYYFFKNCFLYYWKYTALLLLSDVIVFLKLKRNRKKLIWLLSVGGRGIILFYLIWIGRLPERVYFSLFIMTFLMNSGIILNEFKSRKDQNDLKQKSKVANCVLIISSIIAMIVLVGRLNLYSRLDNVNKQYNQILEYSYTHSENRYILGLPVIVGSTAYVLEEQKDTILPITSWIAKSPIINNCFEGYHCNDEGEMLLKDNVFYIDFVNNDISDIEQYMNKRFQGVETKRVDEIEHQFIVYKFEKNKVN